MLIWQSCVNADMKPGVAQAAEDGEVAVWIGLSWWGCCEEMGASCQETTPNKAQTASWRDWGGAMLHWLTRFFR